MDGTKPIRSRGGHRGMGFTDISDRPQSGSQQVYWFKGGMTAWLAQGYRVEKSS